MKSWLIIIIAALFMVCCTTEYYYEPNTRADSKEDSITSGLCTVEVDTAWAGHTFIHF